MTAAAAPERPSTPLSYSGNDDDFLRMLFKGSLLLIPTFGFYRFWLITKIRQHLWAGTQIEGESLEYTGTAKEILIGFLIALAILVPIYIVYFAISIVLGEKTPFANIPLFGILYVLARFGAYRARRYQVSRTIFRGIRFWMTGSGWGYAFRAILCDIPVLLTLGLAYPWTAAFLERYKMRHTYFGSLQGDFAGTGSALFQRVWWLWLLGVTGAAVLGLTIWGVTHLDPKDQAGMIFLITLFAILCVSFLSAAFLAVRSRWLIEGIRFADVALSSNLRKRNMVWLYVKAMFWFLTVALVFLAASVIFAMTKMLGLSGAQAGFGWASFVAIVISIIGYLTFVITLGIVHRYFLTRGLWALVTGSIAAANLDALEQVVAAGGPSGSLGEGLADALDFGGGL
ncbi:YjgN family protein [Microvirga flavescens]|uniref:YjgN family protein n=1 Tax=Microvirga flavescens TaxID=2249811 RepID=UPI000DD7A12A|nr:DUF898 family protein [Microvirga flavescens]